MLHISNRALEMTFASHRSPGPELQQPRTWRGSGGQAQALLGIQSQATSELSGSSEPSIRKRYNGSPSRLVSRDIEAAPDLIAGIQWKFKSWKWWELWGMLFWFVRHLVLISIFPFIIPIHNRWVDFFCWFITRFLLSFVINCEENFARIFLLCESVSEL